MTNLVLIFSTVLILVIINAITSIRKIERVITGIDSSIENEISFQRVVASVVFETIRERYSNTPPDLRLLQRFWKEIISPANEVSEIKPNPKKFLRDLIL